jgi:hypothetical protein
MTSIQQAAAIVILSAGIGRPCAPVLAASPSTQTTKPPAVVGIWTGAVSADVGEMTITVTVRADDAKLTGEITSPHGVFTFTSIAEADGRWTLAFKTSDGATGQMKGVVKGDTFSGEWDFRPRAFGTFALDRSKKS